MSSHVLNKIPPLSEKDCFHVVERYKTEFTFPLHQHKEYTDNYELILISGDSQEHIWEQGECKSKMMRYLTFEKYHFSLI